MVFKCVLFHNTDILYLVISPLIEVYRLSLGFVCFFVLLCFFCCKNAALNALGPITLWTSWSKGDLDYF